MAVVPYTKFDAVPYLGQVQAVQWVLTGSDTGQPLVAPHMSDKTMQIYATDGGGFASGTIAIQGALHPTLPVYDVLTDSHGVALTAIAATKTRSIEENVTLIRPVATSVTSVTIVMLLSSLHLSSL